MEVKIKDRRKDVEYLRMALNMCELGIGYIHSDLILRVQEKLNKLKGKFSLDDAVTIHSQWKNDWEKYMEDQKKENKDGQTD